MSDFTVQTPRGYVLGPDEGDAYWWWGALSVTKVSGRSTQGGLDVVDHRLPPGYAPPLHSHQGQDEVFYILDGQFTISCDAEQWSAGPGSLVFLPRGSVHGFRVEGDAPGRQLILTARAGFADLVERLAEPAGAVELPPAGAGQVSLERMAEVSAELGITYPDRDAG